MCAFCRDNTVQHQWTDGCSPLTTNHVYIDSNKMVRHKECQGFVFQLSQSFNGLNMRDNYQKRLFLSKKEGNQLQILVLTLDLLYFSISIFTQRKSSVGFYKSSLMVSSYTIKYYCNVFFHKRIRLNRSAAHSSTRLRNEHNRCERNPLIITSINVCG